VRRFSYAALSSATHNFSKRLGSGGFGTVFDGALASGTRIAVKKLVDAGAAETSQREQMATEVEVLTLLHVQHANIVPLLGWSEDGAAPCLVYALMEGGSLQDRLACERVGSVPLTSTERITVLSDVARGLAYLHAEVKVIHRDVKSANVLLDRGRVGRIGDFGIAKCLSEGGGGGMTATHVHTQHVIGTQGQRMPPAPLVQ